MRAVAVSGLVNVRGTSLCDNTEWSTSNERISLTRRAHKYRSRTRTRPVTLSGSRHITVTPSSTIILAATGKLGEQLSGIQFFILLFMYREVEYEKYLSVAVVKG